MARQESHVGESCKRKACSYLKEGFSAPERVELSQRKEPERQDSLEPFRLHSWCIGFWKIDSYGGPHLPENVIRNARDRHHV